VRSNRAVPATVRMLMTPVGFLTTFILLARDQFKPREMAWILVKVFFGYARLCQSHYYRVPGANYERQILISWLRTYKPWRAHRLCKLQAAINNIARILHRRCMEPPSHVKSQLMCQSSPYFGPPVMVCLAAWNACIVGLLTFEACLRRSDEHSPHHIADLAAVQLLDQGTYDAARFSEFMGLAISLAISFWFSQARRAEPRPRRQPRSHHLITILASASICSRFRSRRSSISALSS
jgi:hypothetical protein